MFYYNDFSSSQGQHFIDENNTIISSPDISRREPLEFEHISSERLSDSQCSNTWRSFQSIIRSRRRLGAPVTYVQQSEYINTEIRMSDSDTDIHGNSRISNVYVTRVPDWRMAIRHGNYVTMISDNITKFWCKRMSDIQSTACWTHLCSSIWDGVIENKSWWPLDESPLLVITYNYLSINYNITRYILNDTEVLRLYLASTYIGDILTPRVGRSGIIAISRFQREKTPYIKRSGSSPRSMLYFIG